MQHAFLAGTAVALAAGMVGYFLVLRAQVFTADALSHVAFTGALASLAAGLDARIGLFAITILVALGMGGLGRRARPDDVVIGGVFAWILGLGVFFLTLYTTTRSGTGNGSASVTVLFGSIFGLSASRTLLAAPAGAAMRLTARPLLALALSAAIAVISVWIGLTASYLIPKLPPSFAILAVATLTYLATIAVGHRHRYHRPVAPAAAPDAGRPETAQLPA